jgi:hypothetical protein
LRGGDEGEGEMNEGEMNEGEMNEGEKSVITLHNLIPTLSLSYQGERILRRPRRIASRNSLV